MKEFKTTLANDIEAADIKAQYDAEVKKILANKEILAWILQFCTDEFRSMPLAEIIPCIEGEPSIGEESVYPGKQGRIFGSSTEDSVPNEGDVYFDILFYAKAPGRPPVKVYVNIEAQNDFYPGYDLVTRAVFYCARLLSKQLGVEFTPKDYDKIKKVYSIWICINAPKRLQNTISSYQMSHTSLYGEFEDHSRYDLLEAVMIRLGESGVGSQLHRMLNTLLSTELSPEEKEKVLADDFQIDSTEAMKEGLDIMCNLSLGIEEKGMAKGMAKGVAEGENKLASLLRMLVPGSDDFNKAISEDSEARAEVFKKYGMNE